MTREFDRREYDRLRQENDHLRDSLRAAETIAVNERKNRTGFYVGGAVVLSVFTVIAIVTIFALAPERDNSGLNTTVLSVVMPFISMCIALAVRESHLAVNGRMTELMQLRGEASHAMGKLDEQADVARRRP
jgi:Na+/melibiose symporter-like transporter